LPIQIALRYIRLCIAKYIALLEDDVDYEESFEVWSQAPFSEVKRQRRIFFTKCRKIAGPREKRLSAWSAEDGVNITDDTDTMRRKIENLD